MFFLFPYFHVFHIFHFLFRAHRKGELKSSLEFYEILLLYYIKNLFQNEMYPRLVSVPLKISYHLDFLRFSKV